MNRREFCQTAVAAAVAVAVGAPRFEYDLPISYISIPPRFGASVRVPAIDPNWMKPDQRFWYQRTFRDQYNSSMNTARFAYEQA